MKTLLRTLLLFVPAAALLAQNGLQSDTFTQGTLSPFWTFSDAVGTGVYAMTGSHVAVSVPAGSTHDANTVENDAILWQPLLGDSNFTVTVQFDATPTSPFAGLGIHAISDSTNFTRCDLYAGTAALTGYTSEVVAGTTTQYYNSAYTTSSSYWLRVTRTGTSFTCAASHDNATYTTFATYTFSLPINKIAIATENGDPGGGAPAFTNQIKSFTCSGGNCGSGQPMGRVIPDWFTGNTVSSSVWSQSLLRGGSVSQASGDLSLTAPAGATHDSPSGWVQLTQPVANGDFDVIAKLDAKPPTQAGSTFYSEGLAFMQDASNGVYCFYDWNGFSSAYELSCSKIVAGTATSIGTSSRGSGGDATPYYLEIIRGGDTWTTKYSFDGSSWTSFSAITQSYTIASFGLFVDNYNATAGSTLAFTGKFDYVCNAVNDLCTSRVSALPFKFPLMGTSGGSAGSVSISPSSLAFGSQNVGSSSIPQTVTLTNGTASSVTISSIAITGTDITSFSQTNTCGSSLAAHSSCSIPVTFTPASAGARSASLTVTSSPTVPTVALSGTGVTAPTTQCSPPRIVVTCNNNAGDYSLLSSTLSGAGNVEIDGNCLLGSNTITPPANTCMSGTATFTGTAWAMNVTANGVTVNGFTFNGAGVLTSSQGYTENQNLTITNDTFQNITSGNGAILLQTIENNLSIKNNTFSNIAKNGYSTCAYSGSDNFLNAIQIFSGLNASSIEYNSFTNICGDGIHMDDRGVLDASSPVTAASNDDVSYNTFSNVWRIAVEWQGVAGTCWSGTCNFSKISTVTQNRSEKGNFTIVGSKTYYQTWGYSVMPGYNTSYLNNTAIWASSSACTPGAAGLEIAAQPGATIVQGNVVGVTTNLCATASHGFGEGYSITPPLTGLTTNFYNNMICGPRMSYSSQDGGGGSPPGTINDPVGARYYNSSTCPNGPTPQTSNIGAAWTSPNNQNFPSGGTGTWTMYATDNISIRNVSFFIDSATTAIATQEISDVNSSFSSNRQWDYHATFDTSSYHGAHTITAIVTDVSGATYSTTQSFTGPP